MLKKGSFIHKKFYSLLFFNLLSWGAYSFNTMLDAILGGNQLGEVALTAVSIVSPIFSFICFFSYIFTPGCGILCGMFIGEFKEKECNKTAGASMLSSIIIGFLVALLLIIIKMPYLNYYGCTGELLENASIYYNWYIALAVITPIQNTIYYLVITEGGALCLMIGSIENIVGNAVLSYFLCRSIGISGLGMATFLAIFTTAAIEMLHFVTRKSCIRFKMSLDPQILKKAFILSVNTSLEYIFIGLVDVIMNKIILVACGEVFIASYSVVNLILTIFLTSAGVFDSCQGICTSYFGERNTYGIRNVLKVAVKSVYGVGGVMMVVLFFLAPYIPRMYGLVSPDAIVTSVRATRILAISAIPFSFTYFGARLYASLDKPLLSNVMVFLYNFFCPLVLSIPLAFWLGFDGVSIGMSVSSFLVIVLFVLFIRSRYGKEGFPLYLEETGEEVVSFDLKVTQESIVEIRDKVQNELVCREYDIEKIDLLVEELYTRIMEKNPGKTIYSECTLLFRPDHVRIVVRDDGTIFNFVDENNRIESINTHVLNSVLEKVEKKDYLITTSFNRNSFAFEK